MAQQYTAVMFKLQQGCGSYSNVTKGERHSSTKLKCSHYSRDVAVKVMLRKENGTAVHSCNFHITARMWQLQLCYERTMAQQYTAVMFTLQKGCGSYSYVMKREWHSSTL